MEIGVFQVWDCSGDVMFGKKIPLEVACFFYRKEAKKGVEGYLIVCFLVFVEGEELESIRKQRYV